MSDFLRGGRWLFPLQVVGFLQCSIAALSALQMPVMILQDERERHQCQALSASSADTALASGNAAQVRVLCHVELRLLLAIAVVPLGVCDF